MHTSQRLYRAEGVVEVHKYDVVGEVARIIKYHVIQRNTKLISRSDIARSWTHLHPDHDIPKAILTDKQSRRASRGSVASFKVRKALKILDEMGVLERTHTHIRIRDVRKLLEYCDFSYETYKEKD